MSTTADRHAARTAERAARVNDLRDGRRQRAVRFTPATTYRRADNRQAIREDS